MAFIANQKIDSKKSEYETQTEIKNEIDFITSIGEGSFNRCRSLVKITIHSFNEKYWKWVF